MFSNVNDEDQNILIATMESLGMPYEEIDQNCRFTLSKKQGSYVVEVNLYNLKYIYIYIIPGNNNKVPISSTALKSSTCASSTDAGRLESEELENVWRSLLDSDEEEETVDGDGNQLCADCFLFPEKEPSDDQIKSSTVPKRSSDEEIKAKIVETLFDELARLKCNPKDCRYGGTCIEKATIGGVEKLRNEFWGLREERAPSSKEKQIKILDILNNAYCPNTKLFRFTIGNYEVCEAAYGILLGLSRSGNKSEFTYQWLTQRRFLVNGKDEINQIVERFNKKSEKVATYIKYMGDIFCETSPLAGFYF
jgi:hypothetical protein